MYSTFTGGSPSNASITALFVTCNASCTVFPFTSSVAMELVNFRKEFKKHVMDYFVAEYLRGRTPNPCIACNRYVKWESLLKRSMDIGADYIATGHYARIVRLANGRYTLSQNPAVPGYKIPLGRRLISGFPVNKARIIMIRYKTDFLTVRFICRAQTYVPDLEGEMEVTAKIRYSHKGAPCTIRKVERDKALCEFTEPVRAITPGQAVVFYQGVPSAIPSPLRCPMV